MKRLLTKLSADDLRVLMDRYFASIRPFFVQCRHGFGQFATSINELRVQPQVPVTRTNLSGIDAAFGES